MKKLVFALVLLSLIGSITTACKKKYPDDKWGSFRRPANRLSGKTWELETYLLNDQVDHTYDGTYYTQSYSELCFGGGDMKCNEGLIVVNSLIFSPGLSYNWKLSADESTFQSVEVGSAWTPTTPNKTILKLSKNHFWYVYTDEGGTKHEFRMKRKH